MATGKEGGRENGKEEKRGKVGGRMVLSPKKVRMIREEREVTKNLQTSLPPSLPPSSIEDYHSHLLFLLFHFLCVQPHEASERCAALAGDEDPPSPGGYRAVWKEGGMEGGREGMEEERERRREGERTRPQTCI